MDPILGPENLLKTGFAQKGLPSCPSGRHKPQSFIQMEADHLRENPQTPQQQETLQAIT